MSKVLYFFAGIFVALFFMAGLAINEVKTSAITLTFAAMAGAVICFLGMSFYAFLLHQGVKKEDDDWWKKGQPPPWEN